MDASVDRKFSNNRNLTSIFSKVICEKLSDGSIQYLHTRFRMNLAADTVQTQTPKFVDLGLSTIDALDEGSGIITPATRIGRYTNGSHWSAPNHIFGETISVGVIKAGVIVHRKNNPRAVIMITIKIYMHLWQECLVMTKVLVDILVTVRN